MLVVYSFLNCVSRRLATRAWARKAILVPFMWVISTQPCPRTFCVHYSHKLDRWKDARLSANPAMILMHSLNSPIINALPLRSPPWTSASSSTRKWRLVPAFLPLSPSWFITFFFLFIISHFIKKQTFGGNDWLSGFCFKKICVSLVENLTHFFCFCHNYIVALRRVSILFLFSQPSRNWLQYARENVGEKKVFSFLFVGEVRIGFFRFRFLFFSFLFFLVRKEKRKFFRPARRMKNVFKFKGQWILFVIYFISLIIIILVFWLSKN